MAFQLDIEHTEVFAENVEDLRKRRQLLPAKRIRPRLSALGKPTSNVNLFQFQGSQLTNRAINQSGSLKCCIVDNHGHLVTRKPNIKLDAVGAVSYCPRECGKRVFRSDSRGSAVSENEGTGRHDALRQMENDLIFR